MKLLAIDTATDACSCALRVGDRTVDLHRVEPRRHAELVLSMVAELLAQAGLTPRDLDAIAFGCGPGSFTGLRIAAGVTQGLAFGAALPVVAVSTSLATAYGIHREHGATRVVVAADARMGQVYFAAFESVDGRLVTVHPDGLFYPQDTPVLQGDGWFAAGTGWEAHGEALQARHGAQVSRVDAQALPHALDLLDEAEFRFTRGETITASEVRPVYLRHRVAEPSIRRAPGVAP